MGVFAGTYFWFPKMTGHMMNETSREAGTSASPSSAPTAIFMPFHYLGLAGNVRRYSAFQDDFLVPLIPVHKFITYAALFTGAAQLIFIFNLTYSRFKGSAAPANPWECTSLEWSTPSSPPPFDNFGGQHPSGPSRSLSIRGEEFDRRLPDADLSGASPGAASYKYDPRSNHGNEYCNRHRLKSSENRRGQHERVLRRGLPQLGARRRIFPPGKRSPGEPTRTGIWVGLAAIAMMLCRADERPVRARGQRLHRLDPYQPSPYPVVQYGGAWSSAALPWSGRAAGCGVHAWRRDSPFHSHPMAQCDHAARPRFRHRPVLCMAELRSQGLYLPTNPNSSFFYVLTGVHVIHVLGGLGGLSRVMLKFRSATHPLRRSTMDATSYYWHFMGCMWVYLLFILWLKL